VGDWADEKAREWMATAGLLGGPKEQTSLAALLREAGQEERERTNREDWPLAKKAIASIEHDRVLAEVRHVVEDAGKHRVYSDDLLKARDKALRDEILSRLDKL
jgi:hypothetical protein